MDDIGCVYMYSTHVMDMQKIQTKIFPWGSDQSSPYKHVWEKNCRAEKKGIPFYTFRINKHFSVKYDQVSGTDVIFLRQGIQLIPVKKGLPTIVVAWHTDKSILMDDIWASGSELHVVQTTESRLWWTCPSVFLLFVNAISRFSLSLAFVIQR